MDGIFRVFKLSTNRHSLAHIDKSHVKTKVDEEKGGKNSATKRK